MQAEAVKLLFSHPGGPWWKSSHRPKDCSGSKVGSGEQGGGQRQWQESDVSCGTVICFLLDCVTSAQSHSSRWRGWSHRGPPWKGDVSYIPSHLSETPGVMKHMTSGSIRTQWMSPAGPRSRRLGSWKADRLDYFALFPLPGLEFRRGWVIW